MKLALIFALVVMLLAMAIAEYRRPDEQRPGQRIVRLS